MSTRSAATGLRISWRWSPAICFDGMDGRCVCGKEVDVVWKRSCHEITQFSGMHIIINEDDCCLLNIPCLPVDPNELFIV